jgi:hypothetical protein
LVANQLRTDPKHFLMKPWYWSIVDGCWPRGVTPEENRLSNLDSRPIRRHNITKHYYVAAMRQGTTNSISGDLVADRRRGGRSCMRDPEMVDFLVRAGLPLVRSRGYPDYHPDQPGGSVAGRCVEPKVYEAHRLGPWLDKLRLRPNAFAVPMYNHEYAGLALARRTVTGAATAVSVLGVRRLGRTLLRQAPLTGGGGSSAGCSTSTDRARKSGSTAPWSS